MSTIPSKEPARFAAGDTVQFTKSFPEYLPADGWVLSYALVTTGQQITWTGSDNGDGLHLLNVTAATTASYQPGTYHWQSYVTKDPQRFTVGSGSVVIDQNFALAQGGHDNRSHIEKTLEALNALLEGKATKDQLSYSIGGRSLSRFSMTEVIEARSKYLKWHAEEKRRARIERGEGSGMKIVQRFGRP